MNQEGPHDETSGVKMQQRCHNENVLENAAFSTIFDMLDDNMRIGSFGHTRPSHARVD